MALNRDEYLMRATLFHLVSTIGIFTEKGNDLSENVFAQLKELESELDAIMAEIEVDGDLREKREAGEM